MLAGARSDATGVWGGRAFLRFAYPRRGQCLSRDGATVMGMVNSRTGPQSEGQGLESYRKLRSLKENCVSMMPVVLTRERSTSCSVGTYPGVTRRSRSER